MAGWDSRDLVTDSLSPSGTDYDGDWQGIFDAPPWDVALESTFKVLGNNSIKVLLEPESSVAFIASQYRFDTAKDFSDFEYIEFYVNIPEYQSLEPSSGVWFAIASNTIGEEIAFYATELITNSEWTRVRLKLSEYDYMVGSFDITAVWFVRIGFEFTYESQDHVGYFDALRFTKKRVWTGAGADEYWATSGNWEGGNIPDTFEEAGTFDGSQSNKNCIIQVGDVSPGGLVVESNYGGTITISPTEWGNKDLTAIIGGGTIGGNTLLCEDLQASGCTINSVALIGELYTEAIFGDNYSVDSIRFAQDSTLGLTSDLEATKLSLGTGGNTSIIEISDNQISLDEEIYLGEGAINVSLVPEAEALISVNEDGSPLMSWFGNSDNSTSVEIGVSGGVAWDYSDGGSEIRLGHPTATNIVRFYGPSAGASVVASGAILRCYDGSEFHSYGGGVYLGGLWIDVSGEFDFGIGGDLIFYGDVINEGTMNVSENASVKIRSPSDVVLGNVDLWNIDVDSGGNNITVTVSGGVLRGSINVASGDGIQLTAGATWEQAKVKWLFGGVNKKWTTSSNWQLGHVPEADDTAWFTGDSPTQCNVRDAPVTVPAAIIVEPEYRGSNAKIINYTGNPWGSPDMELLVFGTAGDYVGFNRNVSNYPAFVSGYTYIERGEFGNQSENLIYGDLYYKGDLIWKLISKGTDDKAWTFDNDFSQGRYVQWLDFAHDAPGVLDIYGRIDIAQWFEFNYSPAAGLEIYVNLAENAEMIARVELINTYAFDQDNAVRFTMASGAKLYHGPATETGTTAYPGFFASSKDYKFELGASGSGLWDFDSGFTGQTEYGGQSYEFVWGHIVGIKDGFHQGSFGACDATLYGMAPGHRWRARETGLHIAKDGKFFNYGGDLEMKWLEIYPTGYFDLADGELIITDRIENVTGNYDWAILCLGTMVASPNGRVTINAPVDCSILGATLPNLTIDSGGNEITVTASGCTFLGQPSIAEGDRLIILGGETTIREMAPDLGITRKEGDYLVTELDIEMEGD